MDKKTLHGMWNYFLMLESDLDNTSRYIEPQGQENVYSFEFAKLLILACTEVESVFKAICFEIESFLSRRATQRLSRWRITDEFGRIAAWSFS